MSTTRTREEVLEQDRELISIFQSNADETSDELTEDDAVEQAKDFVAAVESALRTLKTNRTNIINDLSEEWNVPEEVVVEYFTDYQDKVEE